MSAESTQRKPLSPRTCTEVTSLHKNKTRNREALERGLLCRRPVKELVNQGILLNPFVYNANKVKELQRAKTVDILKRKIEMRPEKQVLISQRILKANKSCASPLIQERCHALTKNLLCESLNIKLERRLGSLELVEKGVLKVDSGVATLIRGGSIPYPRVSSTSPSVLPTVPENDSVTLAGSLSNPSSSDAFKSVFSVSRSNGAKLRTPSRSLKDETVINRYGSLVFHNYRPSSAASSNSPSLRINCSAISTTSNAAERLPKHRAREVQQAELLHLEDAAQVHKRIGQEICLMRGRPPHEIAQSTQPGSSYQPIVIAQHPQTLLHQCFVISTPSTPPPISNMQPQMSQKFPTQFFSANQIYDDGSGALVTVNSNLSDSKALGQQMLAQKQHEVLASPLAALQPASSAESSRKTASLEEIESVWLNLRCLQQSMTEEASRIGVNIHPSDGFPAAFIVATAATVNSDHSAYQQLNWLSKEYANLCSLARLLISDRLEYLDEIDSFLQRGEESSEQHNGVNSTTNCGLAVSTQKRPVVSNLERGLLQSYLCRLGGKYYQRGVVVAHRARQLSCLSSAELSPPQGNGDVIGIGSANTTLPQALPNSTAYSDDIVCQQQIGQAFSYKLNGSFVDSPPTTEAWVDQLCSSAKIQRASINVVSTTVEAASLITPTSVNLVTAPMRHTAWSMPPNLQLDSAPTTVLVADSLHLVPPAVVTTISAGTSLLPSVGSSSGLVLTNDEGSCSIPASANHQAHQQTHGSLMNMEFFPSDLNEMPSSPRTGAHDLSDVQDFLRSFPFDDAYESMMESGAASPVASSTSATVPFDLRIPPGPRFFGQPISQLLNQDLMELC